MAVEDFAPAVLALSELVKRANILLNGDRGGAVRVLIRVDVEQNCFEFGIQIIHSIWEHTRDLFGTEHIKSAADIAHAIGIGAGGVAGIVGLIGALKKLRGKPIDRTQVVMRDGNSVVQISAGRDVVYVSPDAAKLLTDPISIENAKKTVEPVTKPGYESVEFAYEWGSESIDNEEARLIRDMPTPKRPDERIIPASTIRATVTVRRAVYVGAGKWTIQYDRAREMSVADEEWLTAFQNNEIAAPPGSQLDVSIRMSEIKIDARGEPIEAPEYTITKVHSVILP